MNILRTEHNKKKHNKKIIDLYLRWYILRRYCFRGNLYDFYIISVVVGCYCERCFRLFCMFLTFYAIELVIVVKCFLYFWASKNFTCYYMLVAQYSNWLVYHGFCFSDVVWDWGKILFVIFVSVVCFMDVVLLKAAIACILLSLSLMILLVFVMRQYLFVVFLNFGNEGLHVTVEG